MSKLVTLLELKVLLAALVLSCAFCTTSPYLGVIYHYSTFFLPAAYDPILDEFSNLQTPPFDIWFRDNEAGCLDDICLGGIFEITFNP